MEWKLFLMTFFAIFLAELGDKTQLATMSFAAGHGEKRWTVFYAASAALILTSLLGVVFGKLLADYIDPDKVRIGAGILFIAIGLLFLFTSQKVKEKKYAYFTAELERIMKTDPCYRCSLMHGFLDEIREGSPAELEALAHRYVVDKEKRITRKEKCGECPLEDLRASFKEIKEPDSSPPDET